MCVDRVCLSKVLERTYTNKHFDKPDLYSADSKLAVWVELTVRDVTQLSMLSENNRAFAVQLKSSLV